MKDGGPAYPVTKREAYPDMGLGSRSSRDVVYSGMSLRDWFEGQALIGEIIARGGISVTNGGKLTNTASIAADCLAMADAMLEAQDET